MGMVIVQGVFRVNPDQRDEYLAASVETMRVSREEHHGCLEYVVAADPLDPGRVILSERWESMDDLNAHGKDLGTRRQAAAERGDDQGPAPLSREITIYEVASAKPLG
jgi:quinol monooxygenase YgiN